MYAKVVRKGNAEVTTGIEGNRSVDKVDAQKRQSTLNYCMCSGSVIPMLSEGVRTQVGWGVVDAQKGYERCSDREVDAPRGYHAEATKGRKYRSAGAAPWGERRTSDGECMTLFFCLKTAIVCV
jgi:hypothetical protein